VEHVWVDTAYGKPPVIDRAPAIFKEPAGSLFIVFDFQGIAGDIECTVLVAELGIRGGFECIRIDCTCRGYLLLQQEDVTVECPGTAFRTGGAPEAYIPDDTRKTVRGVTKEGIFFSSKCSDAVRDRNKRYDNHPVYAWVGVPEI
jgi:hypothetical protein